ncbi:MAG: peptide deformylase [Candidatus Komeilibacteria bacterium]
MELTSGLTLVTVPQPILRQKARPVSAITEDIKILAEKMIIALTEFKGVGLAAPQVNQSVRLIVVLDNKGGATVMINPEITFKSKGRAVGEEGCLSVPGVFGMVGRAVKIRYKYLNLEGKKVVGKAKGLEAIIVQHECDHLDGTLFIDKAQNIVEGQSELDHQLAI